MPRKKNVIAPNDEKAVVAMDKQQKALEKADELYGDGLPFDQFRIETRIKTRNAGIAETMIQNGKDYLWLKKNLNHGEFIAALERTCGKSRVWACHCMRAFEMFSNVNSGLHLDLGYKQINALTMLEKPIVEEYLKGGDLGDIPHDDVAKMPVRELETEVRSLRVKLGKVEKVAKEKIRQKDEQITNLEIQLEKAPLPTKEQLAKAELEKLNEPYTFALAKITSSIREALNIVAGAERVEEVNVQQLSDWLGQFSPEMQNFRELSEAWTAEIDNAGPIKDWRISDL